jgi:hypothetical protein
VALKENTLRDTRVFDAGLNNVHGVILKVVENNALAETIVFVRVFDNGLLEVGVELENLTIVL